MNNKNYLVLLLVSLAAGMAQAQTNAPSFLPFQAQLTDASDVPYISTPVTIVVQITNTTGCVLYQENQSVTTDSKGMVSLAVGSGTAQNFATGTGGIFKNVFRNNGTVISACVGGGSTTLTATEGRKIQFNVNGGGMSTGVDIGSVGSAYYAEKAVDADNLGGFSAANYLDVNGVSSMAAPLKLQNWAAAPGSPALGQLGYNSTAQKLEFYNGAWIQIPTAAGGGGDFFKDGSVAMTGTLFMGANKISNLLTPVAASDAATKNYVDSQTNNNNYLKIAGGTMTGPTTVKAGTSAVGQAPLYFQSGTNLAAPESGALEYDGTNLYFSDNTPARKTIATMGALGSYVPLSGGSMTGVLDANSHKITNLTDPTASQDAATKNYVDSGFLPLAGGTVTNNSVGTVLTVNQTGSGNAATINGGNVGIGTAGPTASLDVVVSPTAGNTRGFRTTYSTTNGASNFDNIYSNLTMSPAANYSQTYSAGRFDLTMGSGSSQTGGSASGISTNIGLSGSGGRNNIYGENISITESSGSSTLVSGSSTSIINSSGTITTAYGYQTSVLSSGGSNTAAYGYYAGNVQGTSAYSFYASDVSARNYFNGNTGIGVLGANEKLEVSGNVKIAGQLYTGPVTATSSTTIDWNSGYIQNFNGTLPGSITFNNMKDGGNYILIYSGASAGTLSFSSGGDTYIYDTSGDPTSLPLTASVPAIFNMTKAGTKVYVRWLTGLPSTGYMGNTGSLPGNMGGYSGTTTQCNSVAAGSHMCTVDDVAKALQKGQAIPGSPWISSIASAADCSGWTSPGGNGTSWTGSAINAASGCGTSRPVACCR